MLATVLVTVRQGAHRDPPPVFAVGIGGRDEVSFAAMRTPPWPLLTSPLEPAAAEPLVERWLEVDPDVSAVSGVPRHRARDRRGLGAAYRWHVAVARSARGCTCSSGCRIRRGPARRPLRLPEPDERDLLVAWMEEFVGEAGLIGAAQAGVDGRRSPAPAGSPRVGRRTARVDGRRQSRRWPASSRIGPVYTPPPLRRRGYAGSAVAAVSRRALADGAARCMLFTDLANPTSNKIYAEVGYRRCGDWEEIALERA